MPLPTVIAFKREPRFRVVIPHVFLCKERSSVNEVDMFLISQPYGELLRLFRPNLSSEYVFLLCLIRVRLTHTLVFERNPR